MEKTNMTSTTYTRLPHSLPAFVAAAAVSTAQVAFGARVIDLPGSPPRGAPV